MVRFTQEGKLETNGLGSNVKSYIATTWTEIRFIPFFYNYKFVFGRLDVVNCCCPVSTGDTELQSESLPGI